MSALLALLIASATTTSLTLTAWHGACLPTVTPSAATYRLEVESAARTSVHLRASGVARGWIAAFCTERVCSPFQATLSMGARGSAAVEFELVRDDDHASHLSGTVTIRSDDGAHVAVPQAHRHRPPLFRPRRRCGGHNATALRPSSLLVPSENRLDAGRRKLISGP